MTSGAEETPGASAAPGPGHVLLTRRQLVHVRWTMRGLGIAVAVLLVLLGASLPRSLAYRGLLDENIALKGHIQEIDRKLGELDRLVLRLRLYDAQIRSLAEPTGDHGPLPEDAFSNSRILEAYEGLEEAGRGGGTSGSLEELESLIRPSDLRPAEAWAIAVEARVDTFVSLLALAEPDLTELVTELEGLRALEEALPTAWPAAGLLTSGFGWRKSPFGRSWKFHSGIDIAAARGTPIYAASPGVVRMAAVNEGYGKMLEIDHGFGITTVYAHCATIRASAGDVVERGQLVATIGTTGLTTGPHLHFEVRLDGHPVDPLDYLPR